MAGSSQEDVHGLVWAAHRNASGDGVGFARKPSVFMKAGDTVQVIVEKIGMLENPVVDAG